jgi:hypothetical protein
VCFRRYVWLLFKQPGLLDISASDLQAWTSDPFVGRAAVNVTLFADTYQTGAPIGINWHRESADGVRPVLSSCVAARPPRRPLSGCRTEVRAPQCLCPFSFSCQFVVNAWNHLLSANWLSAQASGFIASIKPVDTACSVIGQ